MRDIHAQAGGRSLVYKFLISSVFSATCLVVAHHEFFKNEGPGSMVDRKRFGSPKRFVLK